MTFPVTAAIRVLREHGITFVPHEFTYVEKGGTTHSSTSLGVPEHSIIKTLIMEDADRKPLCILMHGDYEVSTKALARHLGTKNVQPCKPQVADRHSGYQVGGTSPFGLRHPMPIYAEQSIFALSKIYINGGKRGFLVEITPDVLSQVLVVTPVEVKVKK